MIALARLLLLIGAFILLRATGWILLFEDVKKPLASKRWKKQIQHGHATTRTTFDAVRIQLAGS